jgi:hypothetical protein
MVQKKYFVSKHDDVITSIRQSEQDFHQSLVPLYANHLFCNSFLMSKIEDYLINAPVGTAVKLFDVDVTEDDINLNNGALTCGMELVNGKIDFETNYQIAKYSQNAFIYGLESLDDDDLFLVRDDSLSDNMLMLKYISDNDDDDDGEEVETVFSPDEKRIYAIA